MSVRFLKETEPMKYINKEINIRFTTRNWLTYIGRLTRPEFYRVSLQARDPGVEPFSSKGLRIRIDCIVSHQRLAGSRPRKN